MDGHRGRGKELEFLVAVLEHFVVGEASDRLFAVRGDVAVTYPVAVHHAVSWWMGV